MSASHRPPETGPRAISNPSLVLALAAIVAVTVIALALIATSHPQDAAGVASVSVIAGTILSITYRKASR